MAHFLRAPCHATFHVDQASHCGYAHAQVRRFAMTPATASIGPLASAETGLSLRLAQRAFATLLEQADADAGYSFQAAKRRRAARRTLSALSADDHARLTRWLALQLASGATRVGPACRSLAHVDALLAATVSSALVGVREALRFYLDAGDSERTPCKSTESISPLLYSTAARERPIGAQANDSGVRLSGRKVRNPDRAR